MTFKTSTFPSFVTTFLLFLTITTRNAHGHSFLTKPEPYTREFCQGRHCTICPSFPNSHEIGNTPENPEATWERGQDAEIYWAKNNHDGGFIRLAFVPLKDRLNEDAHEQFAFYYGCFEQNVFPCGGPSDCTNSCHGDWCGADKSGRGFSRIIKVPECIPDGVYYLAFIWYGGIDFETRSHGRFSDYMSCSHIKIEGGAPLKETCHPFFDSGDNGRWTTNPPGLCLSSADEPVICKTGCDNAPAIASLPKPFQNGNSPPPFTASMYGATVVADSPTPTPRPSRMSEPKPDPEVDDTPTPTPHPSRMSEPTPGPEVDGNDDDPYGRICSGKVCCPASCGQCGGKGCSRLPGGTENCCKWYIRHSGRYCEVTHPPCLRD